MAEENLKKKTAKGLLWGGLNNGVQQLLNLVFGIFLARLLSPADYGLVGMLSIFSLVASTLQESGFTAALANRKEVRREDYNAVFWFSALTGLTLYVVLFFSAPAIARFYHQPVLVPLARVLFLGFLMSSLGTAHNAWLFKNLMVKQRALCQMTALLLSGIAGVTLAFLGFAYWGIVTQSLVYIGTNMLLLWHFSRFRPMLRFTFGPLREMFAFSSRILLTNVTLNVNHNILTLILGRFYSDKEVGHYNQANKWNFLGFSVINGMITGVAQPILGTVSDERERQVRVFRKMLRFTAFVSFPALFGLSFVAHELITIAITSKWAFSAQLMQILCVGSAFSAINGLYAQLFVSRGRSQVFMWNTIALCAVEIGAILLCTPLGIVGMVRCYAAINIAWWMVWQALAWHEIRLGLWAVLKDVLPFALIAAGVMVVTYFLTRPITNLYLLFVAKVLLAAALYTGVMWISGAVTFRECLEYFFKKQSA